MQNPKKALNKQKITPKMMIICLITLFLTNPYTIGFTLLQFSAYHIDRIEKDGVYKEEDLNNLISILRFTNQVIPRESITLRYLARAYRMRKQYREAIEVLRKASSLEPDSLIIDHELLSTYQEANQIEGMLEVSRKLGYNEDTWILLGDAQLELGNYQSALRWYEKVLEYKPDLIESVAFRITITLIAMKQTGSENFLKYQHLPIHFLVSTVEETDIIQGSKFRWLSGEYLHTSDTNGFLWWNGRVSAVINVEQSGIYSLRITVCNTSPPPVDMAFGMNSQIIKRVLLTEGDNSWTDIEITSFLKEGFSTIDIWFLNDGYINGEDRNAIIKRVELSIVTSNH